MHIQLDRVVQLRKMTDWAPLIIVSALSGDYLRLALIIATAISAGNIIVDLFLKLLGRVKVSITESSLLYWQCPEFDPIRAFSKRGL
jgi:hypothetical protein